MQRDAQLASAIDYAPESLTPGNSYAGALRLGTPRARTNNSSKDAGKGSRSFVGDWPIAGNWCSVSKRGTLIKMAAGDRIVSGQISWFVLWTYCPQPKQFPYQNIYQLIQFTHFEVLYFCRKTAKTRPKLAKRSPILRDSRLHSSSMVATDKIAWKDQRDKLFCLR